MKIEGEITTKSIFFPPEAEAAFREAGVELSGRTTRKLRTDKTVTAQEITQFSHYYFTWSEETLSDQLKSIPTDYRNLFLRIVQDKEVTACMEDIMLEEQIAQQQSLPFPYHHSNIFHAIEERRPFTLNMSDLSFQEMQRLEEELYRSGIEEIKVSFEIEFKVGFCTRRGQATAELFRLEVITELQTRLDATSDYAEKQMLAQRIDEILTFEPKDLLMLYLIEYSPDLCGFLNPLFGRNSLGSGYYDGVCLELKTTMTNPAEALRRNELILRELFRKGGDFGLVFPPECRPKHQINLSFWQGGRNLFEVVANSKEGRAILAGISQVMYEALPLFLSEYRLEDYANEYRVGAGTYRDDIIRMSKDRMEIRRSLFQYEEDLPTEMAAILAGALYGLRKLQAGEDLDSQVKVVHLPEVSSFAEIALRLASMVETSPVENDGELLISRSDLQAALTEYFALVVDEEQAKIGNLLAIVESDDFLAFFLGLKVENTPSGKMKLKAPSNQPDGTFSFRPDPESQSIITIDSRKISDLVTIADIVPVYVSAHYPDLNEICVTISYLDMLELDTYDLFKLSRIQRMLTSDVLGSTTNLGFQKRLAQCSRRLLQKYSAEQLRATQIDRYVSWPYLGLNDTKS